MLFQTHDTVDTVDTVTSRLTKTAPGGTGQPLGWRAVVTHRPPMAPHMETDHNERDRRNA
jgi:hypothetical protein